MTALTVSISAAASISQSPPRTSSNPVARASMAPGTGSASAPSSSASTACAATSRASPSPSAPISSASNPASLPTPEIASPYLSGRQLTPKSASASLFKVVDRRYLHLVSGQHRPPDSIAVALELFPSLGRRQGGAAYAIFLTQLLACPDQELPLKQPFYFWPALLSMRWLWRHLGASGFLGVWLRSLGSLCLLIPCGD